MVILWLVCVHQKPTKVAAITNLAHSYTIQTLINKVSNYFQGSIFNLYFCPTSWITESTDMISGPGPSAKQMSPSGLRACFRSLLFFLFWHKHTRTRGEKKTLTRLRLNLKTACDPSINFQIQQLTSFLINFSPSMMN